MSSRSMPYVDIKAVRTISAGTMIFRETSLIRSIAAAPPSEWIKLGSSCIHDKTGIFCSCRLHENR